MKQSGPCGCCYRIRRSLDSRRSVKHADAQPEHERNKSDQTYERLQTCRFRQLCGSRLCLCYIGCSCRGCGWRSLQNDNQDWSVGREEALEAAASYLSAAAGAATTVSGTSTTFVAEIICPFLRPQASVCWPSTVNFCPLGMLKL